MPGARHFWPLIWATHAHGSNPLALRIPRELPTHGAAAGAGARGAGPRAPRVGRAAWACHGFCCVPSPAGGGGVGGEMKERREGEKRERQCRRERGRGWRRDRETRRQRKEGGETSRGSPGRQKGERGRGEAAKGKDEQRESPGLPGTAGGVSPAEMSEWWAALGSLFLLHLERRPQWLCCCPQLRSPGALL